ncbi:hypothetical protein [Lactobacillus amylovorus]|nr:unknown [Lactobacillus amylovorus CAG:719]
MSYFDSRVGECPVWQVELIKVMKMAFEVGLVSFITDIKTD